VGESGPLVIGGRFGHWFPASLTALGVLSLVVVLSAALAPVALRGGGPGSELGELASLLDRDDGDTLDPFVARTDKRRVFSADRQAAIGYRYFYGVGLAGGDPVGDPAAFGACIRDFVELCDRHGWRPAVIGARWDRLPLYEQAGLRAVYVGDEAIVDIESFTLSGGRMRNVRHALKRAEKAELTTEIHREADLDPDLREELLVVAALQRGSAAERGFSMTLGSLFTGDHPHCLVVVCRDREGRPMAFQRYALCRQGQSLSLDVMRRRPDAVNGVNERMIVDAIDWGREHGATQLSLNFAAFRTLFEEGTSSFQSAEVWLMRRFDGRLGLQLDTLRAFNAKFQPFWVPRYVIFRSVKDIPAIGLAALSAEGFLPFDRTRDPVPA
jgi:lysyl-tRNA synthetase class 2